MTPVEAMVLEDALAARRSPTGKPSSDWSLPRCGPWKRHYPPEGLTSVSVPLRTFLIASMDGLDSP